MSSDSNKASTNPSSSTPRPDAWLDWLGSAPGSYVLRWQQAQYDSKVSDVFGYHALQCSLPGLDALRSNRMPHRCRAWLGGEWAEPADRRLGASVPTDSVVEDTLILDAFEALPIASDSIDLLVLPHVLEFCSDPHQVLREAQRVLRPDGKLMISGFNPVSFWGARQLFMRPLPSRLSRPYLPEEGQFISAPRLRDWCKLLSFDIESTQYGCFAPPCRSDIWLKRWDFLEGVGDRLWPICGAIHFTTAVKRVVGMRLVGPALRKGQRLRLAPKPVAITNLENENIR